MTYKTTTEERITEAACILMVEAHERIDMLGAEAACILTALGEEDYTQEGYHHPNFDQARGALRILRESLGSLESLLGAVETTIEAAQNAKTRGE